MAATGIHAARGILVRQFGGPDVLKYLVDIPYPRKPTAKEVPVASILLISSGYYG